MYMTSDPSIKCVLHGHHCVPFQHIDKLSKTQTTLVHFPDHDATATHAVRDGTQSIHK